MLSRLQEVAAYYSSFNFNILDLVEEENLFSLAVLDYSKIIGYAPIGFGRGRIVFSHKNFVIKLPYNSLGLDANCREAYLYSKIKENLAPCRLIENILIMRKVEMLTPRQLKNALKKHNWIDSIDCRQVGMYNGRIVAYDYE